MKYKLTILIGYQKYDHKETADDEFYARTKTIDAAVSKFGVNREDVKIISCIIIDEKKPDTGFQSLLNMFGIKK